MNRQERIEGFVDAMADWYSRHKRELPWRDMKIKNDTERAYRVMVSEVMLQQTQVSRVKIVFKSFLELFPSMKDLALASNKDVIMAWRGMGYNSRALRLRDAAKAVVEKHEGIFPQEMDELLSIKGLGPYTAAAIRNFAFNIPTPCIDTNIRRILHRTFVGPENADGTWKASDKELLIIASDVLDYVIQHNSQFYILHSTFPPRAAADWHAALMDYGSLVQTKNNPKWDVCVLTQKGLMKATPKNWIAPVRGAAKEKLKKEPGRMEGAHYVPNRIFRGRIVEALRDARQGLKEEQIGAIVCKDWNQVQPKLWLHKLIKKLVQENMLEERKQKIYLAQ